MSRLTNNKCCVWNAFFNVMPVSLFFSSLQWILQCLCKIYSFVVRVFAGVKRSARQQRLARTSCIHLHFKAKYQHCSEPHPAGLPHPDINLMSSHVFCLFDISGRLDHLLFVLLIFVSSDWMYSRLAWRWARGERNWDANQRQFIHCRLRNSLWEDVKNNTRLNSAPSIPSSQCLH